MAKGETTSIDDLVMFHPNLFKRIQQSRANCKKDGPTLRNKQHFETRLKELEKTYNVFQSNHEVICI